MALTILVAGLSIITTACSDVTSTATSAGPKKPDAKVTLVSFAVTKLAYQAVIPKFVEKWQKAQNQKAIFQQSYGASGSQARAVIDGLEADIVHLALGLDVQRIEKAGLIQPGWEQELPNDAIVTKSVPVIVTRDGNPKGIRDWPDLAKPGVSLITTDPKTSGVARWNFLALWNSVIKTGGDDAKAMDFVAKVYANVPVLTRDAREATDAFFKQGQGDALINYENELILAGQKGEKTNYTIPQVNVSIDNPIAVVDKNVDKHNNREIAEAFVKFLYTPEAQTEFAKFGFRPVSVAQTKEFADKFPPIQTLSTVKDFNGWEEIQKKFFADGAVFDKIQSQIRR
jgi:sulfate transport system substrate-binding protein